MRLQSLIVALVVCIVLPLQAFAMTQINSVRLWRAPDNTRLVFDLTGPVEHSVFTLSAPDRIVIDIKRTKLSAEIQGLVGGKSPITQVRTGNREADELRIVLEIAEQVTPKSFTLTPNQQYGHRLVVDLFDNETSRITNNPAEQPVTTAIINTRQPKLSSLPSSIKRDIVIAIDAGHGGEDPGAIGPGGVREKDIVLNIAKELQRQINSEKGFRAELVRTGDYFIPLRRRTDIARKKGADLFVSIHADAALRTSAFGASVYALSDSGATSETARWLADSENRSDLIGGAGNVKLDDKDAMLAGVLLDLSMTASLSSSLDVGQKVLSNMSRITPLFKKRVEQAGFMVLKSPDMPSILIETGFISNPGEAKKLSNRSHQQAIARSIHSGVRQFFQQNPPPGSYVAWLRDSGKLALGPREHVVRSGESVSLLAQRYQISPAQLRSANKLKSDVLKIGQILTVPATTLAGQ
ncbi:AMIN domain-containing protein [Pseudomonas sp. C27(2019)]|nr:N-acetylmuramoyl-L-alanine amidase [Pseudomonas sp. C27(2019)]QEY58091.1 AMIN domain-containing protein [Pseudomonas sp. C27(2019)]